VGFRCDSRGFCDSRRRQSRGTKPFVSSFLKASSSAKLRPAVSCTQKYVYRMQKKQILLQKRPVHFSQFYLPGVELVRGDDGAHDAGD